VPSKDQIILMPVSLRVALACMMNGLNSFARGPLAKPFCLNKMLEPVATEEMAHFYVDNYMIYYRPGSFSAACVDRETPHGRISDGSKMKFYNTKRKATAHFNSVQSGSSKWRAAPFLQ